MKYVNLICILFVPGIVFSQSFSKITTSPAVQSYSDTRNVILLDVDNNSYPDIHFTNRPPSNDEFYLTFRDTQIVAPSGNTLAGINKVSAGGTFGDINGDCLQDFFLSNGSGGTGSTSLTNDLYENTGSGNFTAIIGSGATSHSSTSSSTSLMDYDGDGDLDIYVSNTGSTYSEFYRNDSGNSFTKIDTMSIASILVHSKGLAWCDYDNDDDIDLFLTNASGDNYLFRNDDTAFHQITTGDIVSDGGSSNGASWADYDGDGWMDLFVSNSDNSNPSPQNFLYRNLGNDTFQRITTGNIATNRGKTLSCAWFDMDNDGDLDLLTAGGHGAVTNLRKNRLYENNGNSTFTEITSGPLVNDLSNSTGVATGDIDKDGYIDLALSQRDGYNELYMNDGGAGNNFISFNILGTDGKASAYNAKVKLKCNFNGNSRWEYRRVVTPNGKSQQSSPIVHYGIGSATSVDSVVIEWLSGPTCTFTNLDGNKFYNVDPSGCRIDTILETRFEDSINYFDAQFTDLSGGDITDWHWDFGDGDTSSLQNPTHTYSTPGSYQVCLTTKDSYCKWDSVCTKVEIICPDTAVADFDYSNNGLIFSFTDSSVHANTYSWDFGDGNFSTQPNPTHVYTSYGEYEVCLAVENDCYRDTICKTITVCDFNPVADYTYQTWSASPLIIQFTDQSQDAVSHYWDFGDGSGSINQNPVKSYSSAGLYEVCLTITDSCGIKDSTCQNIYVSNISIPEDQILQQFKVYPNPTRDVVFVENSTARAVELEIRVYDMRGRLCKEKHLQNLDSRIGVDLSDEPKGLYLLHMSYGDYQRYVKISRN